MAHPYVRHSLVHSRNLPGMSACASTHPDSANRLSVGNEFHIETSNHGFLAATSIPGAG